MPAVTCCSRTSTRRSQPTARYGDVPVLDAVATVRRRARRLTGILVNRSLDAPLTTTSTLRGFPRCTSSSDSQLCDDDPTPINSADQPDRVRAHSGAARRCRRLGVHADAAADVVDDGAAGDGARMTTRRTRTDWSAAAPFRFAVGIEDTFIPQERVGQRRLDEYELTQHYQFWREDLDLVARSGADSLRWGIPWYRVEPEPGRFEWDWVDRVIDHISELGLTCIVDLMHYGTPLWMTKSFLDPDYPSEWPPTPPLRRRATATGSTSGRRSTSPTSTPSSAACAVCGRPTSPARTASSRSPCRSPKASSRRSGRSSTSSRTPRSCTSRPAFRYTGDTFPIPKEILDERRFVVLDLALGRVDADHPMRGWLVRHGAEPERLDRLAGDPVTPGRPRGQLLPGLLHAALRRRRRRPSRSRPAPTASTSSPAPMQRATTCR